ncbi:MAG TPA: formate dehydrogenase accessory sulfurtransferase FdhD [Syntrophales bacterium]|mgnify:CR=1 FL=1|nr:formate dehydrogenase accessory sulfurtransferase FdhD [Syntrophales bacterium]
MAEKTAKESFPGAIKKADAFFYEGDGVRKGKADIIREVPFAVRLNGKHLVTLACAGIHLRELAVGHLYAEGWIRDRNDITSIRLAKNSVSVRTRNGPGQQHPVASPRPASGVPSVKTIGSSGARLSGRKSGRPERRAATFALTPARVYALMRALLASSELHESTRGTHCSGIADPDRLIAAREDIGRHNTLDMLAGLSVLEGLDLSGKILLTTGRISSEMILKAGWMGISFLVSHSAPTTEAVASAGKRGMTLCCSVRGNRMRVYAGGRRVSGLRGPRAE